jgi:hypothetical protein
VQAVMRTIENIRDVGIARAERQAREGEYRA